MAALHHDIPNCCTTGIALACALIENAENSCLEILELVQCTRIGDATACALGAALAAQGACGNVRGLRSLQILWCDGSIGEAGALGLAAGVHAAGHWLECVGLTGCADSAWRRCVAVVREAAEAWLLRKQPGGGGPTAGAAAVGGEREQRRKELTLRLDEPAEVVA